MDKLKSRKFWMCVAAFLASIGSSIGGVVAGNEALQVAGAVCAMLSAAIYAAAEAYVDSSNVLANGTQTSIAASTTAKEVVEAALTKEA